MSERARFRVNEQSFIGHALVNEGAEVFYTPIEGGHVSKNLSPLNDAAQALVDAQSQDHPDKAAHNKAKADKKAAKTAEQAELEAEAGNGPLPKGTKAKGDTRSDKPPARSGKAKGAQTDAGADAGADTTAGEGEDDIA